MLSDQILTCGEEVIEGGQLILVPNEDEVHQLVTFSHVNLSKIDPFNQSFDDFKIKVLDDQGRGQFLLHPRGQHHLENGAATFKINKNWLRKKSFNLRISTFHIIF